MRVMSGAAKLLGKAVGLVVRSGLRGFMGLARMVLGIVAQVATSIALALAAMLLRLGGKGGKAAGGAGLRGAKRGGSALRQRGGAVAGQEDDGARDDASPPGPPER